MVHMDIPKAYKEKSALSNFNEMLGAYLRAADKFKKVVWQMLAGRKPPQVICPVFNGLSNLWILFGQLRDVVGNRAIGVLLCRLVKCVNVSSEAQKVWDDELAAESARDEDNVFKDELLKLFAPDHKLRHVLGRLNLVLELLDVLHHLLQSGVRGWPETSAFQSLHVTKCLCFIFT